MIIRSLCYFPTVKGSRSENAARAIRETLYGFRWNLAKISLAAFAMQALPLTIPFAVQLYLPLLMEESGSNEVFWQALLCFLALAISVAMLRSLAAYYFLSQAGRTGHLLVASLRELAFAQLMRLPASYVERRGSGRILLRFIGDTDALRNWFSKTGPKLVADSFTAFLIAGCLLWVNWRLSLVLVVPLALTGGVIATFAGTIRHKTRIARGRQARLTGFVQAQLGNIRTSKLADARNPDRTEFRSHVAEVSLLNADRDRDAAKLEALAELVICFGVPLLVLAGLPLVWSKRLVPSELIVFVWLALHLTTSLRASFSAFIIQQKALVSIQRLYVLLSRSAERGRNSRCVSSSFLKLSIHFDEQRFDFERGIHEVPECVDTAVLVAALHGFERSKRMTLTIAETPIDQIELRQRRRAIGYLPASNDEVECLADSDEWNELKILVVERTLASLNAFEQGQIEQLGERGIVLFAARPNP